MSCHAYNRHGQCTKCNKLATDPEEPSKERILLDRIIEELRKPSDHYYQWDEQADDTFESGWMCHTVDLQNLISNYERVDWRDPKNMEPELVKIGGERGQEGISTPLPPTTFILTGIGGLNDTDE